MKARNFKSKNALEGMSQAASRRLSGIPIEVQRLAIEVERKERTLQSFVMASIRIVRDGERVPKDVRLADFALMYVRRQPGVGRAAINAVIELFERHANLAYMRSDGGTFRSWTDRSTERPVTSTLDDNALSANVEAELGTHWKDERVRQERTLFDLSTKRKTMRAGKFAA